MQGCHYVLPDNSTAKSGLKELLDDTLISTDFIKLEKQLLA